MIKYQSQEELDTMETDYDIDSTLGIRRNPRQGLAMDYDYQFTSDKLNW